MYYYHPITKEVLYIDNDKYHTQTFMKHRYHYKYTKQKQNINKWIETLKKHKETLKN